VLALPPSDKRPADGTPPSIAGRFRPFWYYVASKSGSLDIADRLIDSITDRFFLLASHPNIGRTRDEDLRPGLRSFPVGEYIIIYRIQDEDVLILRVLRGSRDIAALFGR
jgi:toxin ParE1/3/4